MGIELLYKFSNLAIIGGVLVYFLYHPVRNFFSIRSQKIRKKSEEVKKKYNIEKESHEGLRNKLININQDIQELIAIAAKAGEKEGEIMMVEAENVADRIIELSLYKADLEVKKKNREFYREIVSRSIEKTEKNIKETMTFENELLFGENFLSKLRKSIEVNP